jgi:BASS family bile acid:Na+ symporter
MVATIVKFLIGNLITALMLGVGLAAQLDGFRDVRRRPKLYAKALAVMWIVVPLFTMLVVTILPLRRIPTELFLLMSVCPGAPFITRSRTPRGSEVSIVGLNLLLLTSFMAPLLVPAWIAILNRIYPFDLEISAAQVLTKIVPHVIIPLLLGMVIRALWPRLAQKLVRPVHYFFLVAAVVTIAVGIYLGARVFWEASPWIYPAMLIVILGSALLGYWAARPSLVDGYTVAMSAARGNPAIALAVLAASHPGFRATAVMLAYVLLRFVATLPFRAWTKRRTRPTTTTQEPQPRPSPGGVPAPA